MFGLSDLRALFARLLNRPPKEDPNAFITLSDGSRVRREDTLRITFPITLPPHAMPNRKRLPAIPALWRTIREMDVHSAPAGYGLEASDCQMAGSLGLRVVRSRADDLRGEFLGMIAQF